MLIDFEDIKHKLNNSKWYGTQAWYEILDIIGDCDDKSRPKGKWVRDFSGNEFYWYCSNCKEEYYEEDLYIGGNEFPNFCPNCGADMRGEETEMWDDIYNEIDENIDPCKGCGDYDGGECRSEGSCGEKNILISRVYPCDFCNHREFCFDCSAVQHHMIWRIENKECCTDERRLDKI